MDIKLQICGPEQEEIVQEIFEETPEYFYNTERIQVTKGLAKKEMQDLPPAEKRSSSYKKIFCLMIRDNQPIGVVDLHVNHPHKGSVYIGLFMVRGPMQKKGLGKEAYQVVERYIRKDLLAKKILLGVSEENDVETFWQKNG